MSRIAKNPLQITSGVEVQLGDNILVKGSKGQLTLDKHQSVVIENKENILHFSISNSIKQSKQMDRAWDFAGTTRALVHNMIIGVSVGYEKSLVLVGVGYRAKTQGKEIVLNLGFSHDINYKLPEGIEIELKSPTEIKVKGINKQKVGQVAAEIRSFRPPEPYKGKGVLYKNEDIVRKEVRKKS